MELSEDSPRQKGLVCGGGIPAGVERPLVSGAPTLAAVVREICSVRSHGAHTTSRLSFSPYRRHVSGRLRLNIQSQHICERGTWRGELQETHHHWEM